jgi:hypothetical protein
VYCAISESNISVFVRGKRVAEKRFGKKKRGRKTFSETLFQAEDEEVIGARFFSPDED